VAMLKSWRPEAVTPDLTDDGIRAIGQSTPSQISLNPQAALFKAGVAAGFGWPETSEFEKLGWVFQKWQRGITACRKGDWGNVRCVRRDDA